MTIGSTLKKWSHKFDWKTMSSIKEQVDKKYYYKKGLFYYREGGNKDKAAGWQDKDGYLVLYLNGKNIRLNRLVWMYFKGDTEAEIDHIDGDRLNNELHNLREASRTENNINRSIHADNKSGFKGVVEYEGKFKAYTKVDGMTKNLGTFNTAKEASNAYEAFTSEIHGDFKRK
jgi:hypothetical protein